MDYVKLDRFSIKNHPELNETWVQDRIAEDPSILGLGDLVLKGKERRQPHAGRLDLLFQDLDANRRYEVEVQLGSTDESHIIRTLEYWDIEKKRYPQYEHTAVIVAEDITSRFLNVIGLFNGMIPLIAIQMNALRVDERISLFFTIVLDQLTFGPEESEEVQDVVDRAFWEKRASQTTLSMADQLLLVAKKFDPDLDLKYNKSYIGMAKNGQPNNFVIFKPKKNFLRIEPRLKRSDDTQERLEAAGLDVMDYDERWGRYRIQLSKDDISSQGEIIDQLFSEAYSSG